MKSPRLPYYFHWLFILLMFLFVLPVAWTVWVGLGALNLNRTISWGQNLSPWTLIFIKMAITSLPILIAGGYFLKRFFRRKEVHLGYSLLITGGAVLLSLAIMPLLQ